MLFWNKTVLFWYRTVLFWNLLREDTHRKKNVFFSGRTTKRGGRGKTPLTTKQRTKKSSIYQLISASLAFILRLFLMIRILTGMVPFLQKINWTTLSTTLPFIHYISQKVIKFNLFQTFIRLTKNFVVKMLMLKKPRNIFLIYLTTKECKLSADPLYMDA